MSRCLVIGRTPEDVDECREYGLKTHNPAPSTMYWNDYWSFDGDVITCHTVKFDARWACSVECSPRVIASARKYPGRHVIGSSALHVAPYELEQYAIVLRHENGFRHPDENSGVFALWWAFRCGYDEIYTSGIDLRGDYELLAKVRKMIDAHPNQYISKACDLSALPVPVCTPPVVGGA